MRTRSLTGNLTLALVVCLTVCSCAPREYAKEKIACHVVDWRWGGSDAAVPPMDIYVMSGDGTGRTHVGEGREPDWAPDGHRLVVVGPSRDSLYVLDTESGEVRMLLDFPDGGVGAASWSPDGRTIAFAVRSRAIWTIHADGSNLQQLAEFGPAAHLGPPSWSPDGAQITFSMYGDCRDEAQCTQIYVMGSDGSGVTRLTDGRGSYRYPVWSPKGDRIAFEHAADGEDSVYVINADGSGQSYVVRGRLHDWSPDGTRIYYHTWRTGHLRTVDVDGSNRWQLFELNCEAPAWAPVVEQ